jgi:hypothetical protein
LREFFRKSTILILVFMCSTVSLASSESLSLECLKRYLKDRKITEDVLSYVNPYIGSLTDCESAVRTKLASIYSDTRNTLSSDRKLRPFVECAMRDLEEEDDESYEKNALTQTAVEMISNWRFWSYFSKSSLLDTLKAKSKQIINKSILKCKGNREFGELFASYQEGTKNNERTGEEEYCIRKYLVERNMTNPRSYGFRDNPRNVRTEIQKCNETMEVVTTKIYEDVRTSKDLSNCFLNVYRNENYADQILKAELLSKLTLERWDKTKEKLDFINAMVDITYATQEKC